MKIPLDMFYIFNWITLITNKSRQVPTRGILYINSLVCSLKNCFIMVYCSKYSRPAGPWVQQYKIQIQCLMTGKLNKQAVLSVVSNAIQSKAHRNTKSTLVQHSNVDPLLARHIKAKSRPGLHRALHRLINILFHPMTISRQKSTPWTR